MAALVMLSAVLLGLLLPFSMADNNNILNPKSILNTGESLTDGNFNNILNRNGTLNTGEALVELPFIFIMQDDCNLMFYNNDIVDDDKIIWYSNTSGKGENCVAHLQTNGNLVILGDNGKGEVIWASDSTSPEGYFILLVHDGHVGIYDIKYPIWTQPDDIKPTNMKIRKKIAMVTKTN